MIQYNSTEFMASAMGKQHGKSPPSLFQKAILDEKHKHQSDYSSKGAVIKLVSGDVVWGAVPGTRGHSSVLCVRRSVLQRISTHMLYPGDITHGFLCLK